jgi:hypothetical protein
MNRRLFPLVLLSGLVVVACVTEVRDADACGGCFHEPPPPPKPNGPPEVESVITDHRMVFSISQTQTVLWDQVRYAGDPKLFAWVLPIHPGARIELSHDAFIAALDASTRPVVSPPPPRYCPGSGFSSGGGGGGGIGCGASSESATMASGGGTDFDAGSTPGVTVISQETVGPYEAVTLRSTMGDSLETWLTTNGFDVPASIQPTLSAYAAEGFDFIALKLQPGQGVQAMQPVRIVTQGADLSLPLRMIAAGVGANVGLELYVIAEGRYHTQNFPDAVVDFAKLTWNGTSMSSNFAQLEEAALTAGDGRGWITQAATQAPFYAVNGTGLNPGLYETYVSLCQPTFPPPQPACDAATAPPVDASSSDAADDGGEGGASDGGSDAAAPDAATCPPPPPIDTCDDIDVATLGIQGTPWVTRLRARLPAQALGVGDLRLEATVQSVVSNLHQTSTYSDPSYDPCPPTTSGAQPSSSSSGCSCNAMREDQRFGTWLLLGVTAFGTAAMLRRRKRR